MKIASLLVAASSLQNVVEALSFCEVEPTTVTNFDPKKFAGIWYMHSSTFYAKEETGCVKLVISEPNSKGLLNAGLRSV